MGYTARKPKEENLPDKDTAATAPDPPETIPPEADSGTEGLRQALIDSASGGYLSGALRVRTSIAGPPAVTPRPAATAVT